MSIGFSRLPRHVTRRAAALAAAARTRSLKRAVEQARARGRLDGSGHLSTPPAPGFTLVEILVAFAVAVLLLGILHELFAASLRAAVSAGRLEEAVIMAQSALDAGAASSGAADQTENLGPYQRRVRVRPRFDLPASPPPAAMMVYEVDVSVAWRDGLRMRTVALSTLHPGPATPP